MPYGTITGIIKHKRSPPMKTLFISFMLSLLCIHSIHGQGESSAEVALLEEDELYFEEEPDLEEVDLDDFDEI